MVISDSERFGPATRLDCDAKVEEKFAPLEKLLFERFSIGSGDALVDNGTISLSFDQCIARIKRKLWSLKEVELLSLAPQLCWTVCALAWLPAGLDVQFLAAIVAVTPQTAIHFYANWGLYAELHLRRMDCFDERWTHLFSLLEQERTAGLFRTGQLGMVLIRLPVLLDHAAYKERLRTAGSWAQLVADSLVSPVLSLAEKCGLPLMINIHEQLAHVVYKHGLAIRDEWDLLLPYLLYTVPKDNFYEIDRVLSYAADNWHPTPERIDSIAERFSELSQRWQCFDLANFVISMASKLSSRHAFSEKELVPRAH